MKLQPEFNGDGPFLNHPFAMNFGDRFGDHLPRCACSSLRLDAIERRGITTETIDVWQELASTCDTMREAPNQFRKLLLYPPELRGHA